MVESFRYPIAETFCSPQGEGLYAGQVTNFIRLAGCTVGKPFPTEMYITGKPGEIRTVEGEALKIAQEQLFGSGKRLLPIYTEMCTIYDGRTFECDTDYRVKARMTAEEILEIVPNTNVKRICLTGGEPMMYDLTPLLDVFFHNSYRVSIETSGTQPPKGDLWRRSYFTKYQDADRFLWITVSPKFQVLDDMLSRADEIKLLVDEEFDIEKVPSIAREHKLVYIQPVNFENSINTQNLQRCLKLQEKFPNFRISLQMHKILGVR